MQNESPGFELSVEQVARYKTDGYLAVDNVLSKEEVESLLITCDSDPIRKRLSESDSESIVHVPEITLLDESFMALAKHPAIIGRVQSLLGQHIQLQHSKFAAKPLIQGQGRVTWHQDFTYIPHTNSDMLAVMVWLDDATTENGCMQMIRGSHKWGDCGENSCDDPRFLNDRLGSSDIVNVELAAGGISIHSCLMVHGSPPNVSGRARRSVVFEYRADDCFQIAGPIMRDTGIMVAGENQHKVRCDIGVLVVPQHLKRNDSLLQPVSHSQ